MKKKKKKFEISEEAEDAKVKRVKKPKVLVKFKKLRDDDKEDTYI